LTLGKGVLVKGSNQANVGSFYGLTVQGTLNVEGTSDKPVVFTSFWDDSQGGDTNGDVGASGPAAGQWAGIVFSTGSKGNLQNLSVSYGPTAISVGAGSAPSIVHANLSHNATGLAASGANSAPSITDSVISTNTAGITAAGGASVIATNNWWGAASGPGGVGPGAGDTVTAGVSYMPFKSAAP
jgi:hypothetical protein